MSSVIRVKDGVQFKMGAPGGFVLLAAITEACASIGHDVTITSGCDGEHSGPNDPHHRGEAYDVRTKDVPDKNALLGEIQKHLDPARFFAFIEAEGTDNEHIHAQVKKGTTYP
jgi:hypothetical protein